LNCLSAASPISIPQNPFIGTNLQQVANIEELLTLVPDDPSIYTEWKRIVMDHNVQRVKAYDASLIAVAMVHGVGSILAFTNPDFKRFSNINASRSSSPACINPAPANSVTELADQLAVAFEAYLFAESGTNPSIIANPIAFARPAVRVGRCVKVRSNRCSLFL